MSEPLTRLEREILAHVAARLSNSALAIQARAACVADRKFTGVGLFATLALKDPNSLQRITSHENPIHGPLISSPVLEHGAGSLVWLNNGFLDFIETFAYGSYYPDTEFDYSLT